MNDSKRGCRAFDGVLLAECRQLLKGEAGAMLAKRLRHFLDQFAIRHTR